MKRLLTITAITLVSTGALANDGPMCTEAEVATWMSEKEFVTMAGKLGYKVDELMVTSGNCYALSKIDGTEGEMDYFNPVTGVIVQ